MIVNLDSTSTAGNINRLWDSKFQAFPIFWLLPENGSNLVIFAITCQNNLFPGGAGGGGWVPPHWIVKQLRHSDSTAGSRTKDLTLQALEESCIQTEGPSFEKTLLRGSQKWCQLVPVLAPYLEAVYRKPTLRHKRFGCLGKLKSIIQVWLTGGKLRTFTDSDKLVSAEQLCCLQIWWKDWRLTESVLQTNKKQSNKWVAW